MATGGRAIATVPKVLFDTADSGEGDGESEPKLKPKLKGAGAGLGVVVAGFLASVVGWARDVCEAADTVAAE